MTKLTGGEWAGEPTSPRVETEIASSPVVALLMAATGVAATSPAPRRQLALAAMRAAPINTTGAGNPPSARHQSAPWPSPPSQVAS